MNSRLQVLFGALLLAVGLFVARGEVMALDAPHDKTNGISCGKCHWVLTGTLPFWNNTQNDLDDTRVNKVCWFCHNDVDAPMKETHSSTILGTKYGVWTRGCRDCHEHHYQKQSSTWPDSAILNGYIATTPAITYDSNLNTSLVTLWKNLSGQKFTWNQELKDWKGYTIKAGSASAMYKILSNGDSTLTVRGDASALAPQSTFVLFYGKDVNYTVNYADVKFFDNNGASTNYSFVDNDGDSTVNGICQVCHTKLRFFRSDGSMCTNLNFSSESTCSAAGAKWIKWYCAVEQGQYTTKASCETNGGSWTNWSCSDSQYKTQATCQAAGKMWTNWLCQDSQYTTKAACQTAGLEWSNPHAYGVTGRENCAGCHNKLNGFKVSCEGCHGSKESVGAPIRDDGSDMLSPPTGHPIGQHRRHVVDYGFDCQNCHNGFVMPNGVLTLSFSGIAEGGQFDGKPFADATYSYSAGVTMNTLDKQECNNIYCHSSGQSADGLSATPVYALPDWGDKASGECGSCHGGDGSTARPKIATGSHVKHVTGAGIACSRCHNGNIHLNGIIDVPVWMYTSNGVTRADGARGNGYGYCSNASCHSIVQKNGGLALTGAAGEFKQPLWGSANSVQCGSCHNGNGVDGDQTLMDSGSHSKHLSSSGYGSRFNCETCHGHNGSGSLHVNDAVNVFSGSIMDRNGLNLGSASYSGSISPGDGYGNCSALYCHSDGRGGVPNGVAGITKWGETAVPADCTFCHKNDHSASLTMNSGSHDKHVRVGRKGCVECHNDTVSDNRTIKDKSKHLSKAADVAWGPTSAGGDLYQASGSKTCSNIYCHSDGTKSVGGVFHSPVWGQTLDCSGCHGTYVVGNVAAMPDYANGTPKTNSHAKHVETSGFKCSACHNGTTTDGVSITNPSLHINGTYDIQGGTPYSFSYDLGTRRCSNANCHGGNSPVWGGSAFVCFDCHKGAVVNRRQIVDSNGDGTGTGGDFMKTSHHVIASIPTKADCEKCHDLSQHAKGNVRLKDADTGAIYVYDAADPSTAEPFCLSCHDDDGAAGNMAPFSDGAILGQGNYVAATTIRTNWNKQFGHGDFAADKRVTCLGNGTPNTGCHGNAHGTDNKVLFAANLTLPIPSVVPDEYNLNDFKLCFDCHSSYPRVSKESVLGVKQGGRYDGNYGPNGQRPPYYLASIQTKFRDQNNFPSQRAYDDFNILPGINLHWYHISTDGFWVYRGVTGGATCVTCHSVHGSGNSVAMVRDQMNYNHYSGDVSHPNEAYGILDFSTVGNSNNALRATPVNCTYTCHSSYSVVTPPHAWFEPPNE
ncbi:MAG: CxxxxCH/CxxCH domain-containing protein [Nitrospirae bacterium]|nr:CxxxxCH/CxxCH domain-containing protein [Nitrospirota bacterium]